MKIKAETVRIPASVTQLGYCVFPMVRKIEVYDTIDPQAKPAASFCDSMNGSPNGHLGLIGFSMGEGYVKYACNGSLWDHTITVLSAVDHSVKYKVRMPSEQQRSVYCTYASSWGRNAEFNFKAIEDIFQNLTADAKQDFVLDGLRYGVLSQSFQESLGGYVKKNALALCRSAIQEDNLQLLQTLEEYDVIKNLIAEQLLALAEQHNSISCKAWLLKNTRVPAKNGNALAKELPVSELKKIWSYKKESEDGLTITSYRGIDVDVIVPEKIGKQSVIAIADDCFSINKDAETQRFLRTELRSVVIPDTVKVIGKRAFAHCEGLESVRLPAGLTELSEGMFHGCKNLHIEIPEGITKICGEALSGCPMDRIQIPASVDWVRAYSFGTTEGSFFWYVINQGMPNLEAFSVAAGNQAYCAIDGVLFTADKKTLVCYPHAKKDESYTVPTGVKKIQFGAFSCCKYLKHLDLTSVSEIETCAFSYCLALESIDFSEKNKKMSSAIIGCSALKEITLPKQMKELPERMFDGCRSLQRVVLPPELKKIGRRAFADCRELTEIELPQSVKSIGFYAFKGCRNLHSLIVNSPDTKAEFCDLGCATVYAPKDSKMSAYAKEHGHKLVEKE